MTDLRKEAVLSALRQMRADAGRARMGGGQASGQPPTDYYGTQQGASPDSVVLADPERPMEREPEPPTSAYGTFDDSLLEEEEAGY